MLRTSRRARFHCILPVEIDINDETHIQMFGLSIFILSIKGQVTETALHFLQPHRVCRLYIGIRGFERQKNEEKRSPAQQKSHKRNLHPSVSLGERNDIKSTAHLRCKEISQAVSKRRIFFYL